VPGDPRRALAADGVPEAERRWVAQQFLPFQRSAEASTLRALEWLGQEPGPFFLWIHYFDPHMSYQPPAPWDQRYDGAYPGVLDGAMTTFMGVAAREGWTQTSDIPPADWQHMVARYDGELSFVDHWIGRLSEALQERGDWEDSLVVVVGDHGEAFGEHGQIWEHNAEIYDEVVRVPLLVKLPDGARAGERITRLVRTIDVAPTLLAVAGMPGLDGVQGESLLLEPAEPRDVLLQALRGRQALPTALSRLGVRTRQEKLILTLDEAGRVLERELFDLDRDPEERSARGEADGHRLEEWTKRTLERHREPDQGHESRSWRGIDPMTSEALEALGYLDPGR
jgi:arylsulfatase A-like enzyme